MQHIIKFRLIGAIFLLFAVPSIIMPTAIEADCAAPPTLSQKTIYFYDTKLGVYNVNLASTLNAIENNDADSGNPYYEKTWYGDCPAGLKGPSNSCIEFTVYPDETNFYPGDIMQAIEDANDGRPNRGEVRILTDQDETHFVYTIDHEKTFCGPYTLLGSSHVL